MRKLAITAESVVLVTFLVMNLDRWLKAILFWLFYNLRIPSQIESPLQGRPVMLRNLIQIECKRCALIAF
jgi:hypothetical protein